MTTSNYSKNLHQGNIMATIEDQEYLLEVLKFTPRTYRVSMWGYGGERVMGTVSREIYDYFCSRRLDLSDFAWNSEYAEENNIPEEMWPFSPGSWYECDDMGHINGVSKDAGSMEIFDENGNSVLEIELGDCNGLDDGPELSTTEEIWIDERGDDVVVFVGTSNEKGTFFEGAIELTAPFDITKLTLLLTDFDCEEFVVGVSYNDVDIDNDGGGTDGKSSDFGFYIAGSQKYNNGQYIKYTNMDDIEYPMTEWFPKKIKPAREGIYTIKTAGRNSWTHQAKWTGARWISSWSEDVADVDEIKIKAWQGLAVDPEA